MKTRALLQLILIRVGIFARELVRVFGICGFEMLLVFESLSKLIDENSVFAVSFYYNLTNVRICDFNFGSRMKRNLAKECTETTKIKKIISSQ